MPVLLIFMKPCRLEKVLVVEKKDIQESETRGKDNMRKHDAFPYITPVWGLKERLDSPLITPIGIFWVLLIQFCLCAWPHHEGGTVREEGEVMKRGETTRHHQVILLPIAL